MKNSKIKVSIIIPIFNADKYLHTLIPKLLYLLQYNVELLLIDDGSTDDSLRQCKEYATRNKRIVVLSKENGGVSSARNAGIKVAKGDYLMFVDADDQLYIDALKEVIQNIVDTKIHMYCFGFKIISNNKRHKIYSHKNKASTGMELLPDYVFSKVPMLTGSFLISRELVLEKGLFFNEKYKYGEDQHFIIRGLMQADRVLVSEKLIYCYVKNSISASAVVNLRHFDYLHAMLSLKELEQKDSLLSSIVNYKIQSAFFYVIDSLLAANFSFHEIQKYIDENNLSNQINCSINITNSKVTAIRFKTLAWKLSRGSYSRYIKLRSMAIMAYSHIKSTMSANEMR